MWPSDTQDLQNLILTDEGEMFSPNSDPDLYDKEGFKKLFHDHHEMRELGLKRVFDGRFHRVQCDGTQSNL